MTYGQTTNNDIGVPTKERNIFNGWYMEATNGTQVYDSTGTWKYLNNVVLYAQWA